MYVHRSLCFVVPEHLNATMIGTLKYSMRVFCPEIKDRILLKIVEKCNLGLKSILVPFLLSNVVDQYPCPLGEGVFQSVEDSSHIMAQFRSFPVEVLLPLRLHTVAQLPEIDALNEGDLVFAIVRGRRNEIFDRQLSIVAVLDSLYLTKERLKESLEGGLDQRVRLSKDDKDGVEEQQEF